MPTRAHARYIDETMHPQLLSIYSGPHHQIYQLNESYIWNLHSLGTLVYAVNDSKLSHAYVSRTTLVDWCQIHWSHEHACCGKISCRTQSIFTKLVYLQNYLPFHIATAPASAGHMKIPISRSTGKPAVEPQPPAIGGCLRHGAVTRATTHPSRKLRHVRVAARGFPFGACVRDPRRIRTYTSTRCAGGRELYAAGPGQTSKRG